MKKYLLLVAVISCLYGSRVSAQAPNLPTKGALSQTILTNRAFSNGTQTDTVVKYRPTMSEYTLEVVGKVNSATGRGLDIEDRNAKAKGIRLSIDASNLKLSSSLSSITPLSVSQAGVDQTIRIAVRNDSAHIYHNGAYIQSQPLSAINDIVAGAESSVIQGASPGPNLVPGWAGVSGNYAGKPSDYGWSYNGTTVTNLFNTANSTAGGSRYVDVNSTSSTHTYNGATYNGRVLYIRWDGAAIAGTVYTYPVTLEANTTYNFSMLNAYLSNATGAKTITVGIGKTTAATDRYASHDFNPSGTSDLKRDNFSFTSQEAGTYYLTFTGTTGLFSIAELSLNKNLPSSLMPNWCGIAPNNTGTPANYSWAYTGTTVTTLFNTANGTSGVRYMDVNASSGSNVHTYNGASYVGRVLYIRWDGSGTSGTVYNYPVMLEANTTYNFSMLHAYISNATGGKTMTVGLGKTTAAADRFESHTFVTSGTRVLNRESFSVTSKEAGLYYITITGDWALFSIAELTLNKIDIKPRFIFGKDYPNGAVDMNITSVTYDSGAYAPAPVAPGPRQDVIVTGATASFLPTSNTNFIVPGKTDMHLTGASSPLINSTVQLNSDDSWLFFDNIKPSLVIANWLSMVTVNGAPAANNPNVRVSIYKNGTVVIPNGNVTSTKALQVYTGANLSGATTTYEITTYHDSLGTFNNAIRSFKLKRGYMATFASNADGSGFSRNFIANDADLIVNTMPQGLDASTSFIRVFKWDWVSKKGKAGWSPAKVGATWYYDWNIGGAESADYNYSIIRQNGNWPAWSDIRNKQNVNHLLGFNEPDQANQSNLTVAQAVQQWPQMMNSGLRVGSPAPANPESSWITNFLAKTDSLNLRVDFVAIHCYWGGQTPQQWYSRLKSIYNRVKRPLWITEWNNGANWTGESWPSDTTQALQKQLSDLKGIMNVLDTASFVERYAEYDWVEYKRSLVLADTLTPAGKYYYDDKSALAYNAANPYVHTWQLASPQVSSAVNKDDYTKITLSWADLNGEMASKYVLERMITGVDAGFTTVKEITGYPYWGTVTCVDSAYARASYRVKVWDLAGVQYMYSPVLIVVGDAVPVAPASLTGSVVSSTITKLAWNAGANARSYNLKRSTDPAGPFTTILGRTTKLSYQDTTLSPNTTYYYAVTSLNSAGESANSTVLQLTTLPLVAPATVVNPHAASGDARITLTWDFIYDAKYEVSRSESQNGTYTVIATNINAVRYEDTTVPNGTTYYYKIVAYNDAGRSPETAVLQGKAVLGQYMHLAFNENTGTFTQDEWGGYNGTIVNGATWVAGKDGPTGALNLVKSTSSYVQLPGGVVSTLNNFTISAWVKLPTTLATNTRIFDFGSGTSNFMILIPKSGSNVRYKITSAAGTNDRYMPYVLPLDQWVHIAITQQGATFKFYVNGALQYADNNATVKPSDLGITPNNYLGKSQYSTDPYSDHIYDDFKIYNRALSDAEIANLTKNDQSIVFNTMVQQHVGDADFDPMATASSGLPVSYTSSDTTIASIANGMVHIKAAGTSVITALQTGDSSYANAASVSQTLTVVKNDQTITFDAIGTRHVGDADFDAMAVASSNLSVSYSSSDTTIASIVNGLVHIKAAGTSVITALQTGDGKYAGATSVDQTLTVVKNDQTITFDAIGGRHVGDADFDPMAVASSNLSVSYSSSDTTIASIVNGLVHIKAAGTSVITALQTGSNAFNAAVAVTQVLTVNKLDQSITFNALVTKKVNDIDFGTGTSASSGLPLTYTSSDSTVAVIVNGLIHITGVGSTAITALQSGNAVYLPASPVTQTLTVNKLTQAITFSPLPTKRPGDADLALTATATSGLVLTYTSRNSNVAVIVNGKLHIIGAGTTTVTASQAGNGTYNAATASQIFTVLPYNLQVQYLDGDNGQLNNNVVRPYIRVANQDTVAVAYNELTIRYWFTAENYAGMNTWIDYAQMGNGNVSMNYVALSQPRNGALGYVEYKILASGNISANSNSGPIQSRFANQDWSILNEADDYSYQNNTGSYAVNPHITMYRNGVLIWGVEPALVAAVTALSVSYQNQNQTASSNTISTYLVINNTGNVPVGYGDVTVRYWFTEDGSQSMNYWIDYAKKGSNNITGKFVTLSNALPGADHYFETAVKASVGTLYPLSNSGNIQYRLTKADWSNFNEANDYSYVPKDVMKENNRITVYYKGALIYGIEPVTFTVNNQAAYTADIAAKVPTPVDMNTPLSNKVFIYPNPLVDTRFSVKLTNDLSDQTITVRIRDVSGKILQNSTIKAQGDVLQVQLSGNYAAGVYFVQLNSLPSIRILINR